MKNLNYYYSNFYSITLFSEDELPTATNSLQNRKAPGHNGIPVEALKAARVSSHACEYVQLLPDGRSFLREMESSATSADKHR